MAGPCFLLHFEKQHILVAIDEPPYDPLRMSARFAFEPKFSAGSTPIGHQSALQSESERFTIHPGEHQNAADWPFGSRSLLNDYRNQAVISKFEIEVHGIASAVVFDNLAKRPRQYKEMLEPAKKSTPSSLRYRQRPLEKIRLLIEDFWAVVPPEHLRCDMPGMEFIDLDADTVLSHIVPQISVRDLARERPDLFFPADHAVKLPPHRVALAYRLREESYDPNTDFSSGTATGVEPSTHLAVAAQNLDRLSKTQILPIEPVPSEPFAPPNPPAPTDSQDVTDQPQRLIELLQSLPTFHRFSPTPPVATIIEPLILETENPGTDIPEQDSLQALFLTDEKLTIRRVVELCGELPGIRSCVLTCDDTVVASHNVPENLDLVAMSSTASKMLAAMQESSSQLGIGAVPALTLHTDRGPLSLVQNNRLTLLVVHADRGFIPGVREKLTATLGELSRTTLALPSAAPAGGMPLPPTSE